MKYIFCYFDVISVWRVVMSKVAILPSFWKTWYDAFVFYFKTLVSSNKVILVYHLKIIETTILVVWFGLEINW